MRFIVSDRGLEPWDDAARDCLNHLIESEVIEIELIHPRDMNEHRHIMAQIADVARLLHVPFEKLRAELLVKTGNFQLLDFKVLDKDVIAVNSMSRHHMRDHELHAFWQEAKDVIFSEYLPRIKDSPEKDHVANQLSLLPA
jgi:hypothetical protein